ncbi:RDD family protein [Paenisporosarcina sp. TG20]|uniref:RDD family protein n=1 Tax=Paenisporosarcina sp. TG20 TaxID=1211706 RepID=UPI0003094B30|nr:RDD family protein [Paenisporosarcina sp. TG20]
MTDRHDTVEPESPIDTALQTPTKKSPNKFETEQFTQKPAGFWIRFWAYLIDILVISSISSIIVYPLFRIFGWDVEGTTWYAPIGFITGILFYAYFVLMTKFLNQTVGKMIFGLQVISLKNDTASWVTILFREWIGRFFSATIWPLYWVIGFTPKKQGLHDFIADTMVIHEHAYEKKIIPSYKQVSESSELQQP